MSRTNEERLKGGVVSLGMLIVLFGCIGLVALFALTGGG